MDRWAAATQPGGGPGWRAPWEHAGGAGGRCSPASCWCRAWQLPSTLVVCKGASSTWPASLLTGERAAARAAAGARPRRALPARTRPWRPARRRARVRSACGSSSASNSFYQAHEVLEDDLSRYLLVDGVLQTFGVCTQPRRAGALLGAGGAETGDCAGPSRRVGGGAAAARRSSAGSSRPGDRRSRRSRSTRSWWSSRSAASAWTCGWRSRTAAASSTAARVDVGPDRAEHLAQRAPAACSRRRRSRCSGAADRRRASAVNLIGTAAGQDVLAVVVAVHAAFDHAALFADDGRALAEMTLFASGDPLEHPSPSRDRAAALAFAWAEGVDLDALPWEGAPRLTDDLSPLVLLRQGASSRLPRRTSAQALAARLAEQEAKLARRRTSSRRSRLGGTCRRTSRSPRSALHPRLHAGRRRRGSWCGEAARGLEAAINDPARREALLINQVRGVAETPNADLARYDAQPSSASSAPDRIDAERIETLLLDLAKPLATSWRRCTSPLYGFSSDRRASTPRYRHCRRRPRRWQREHLQRFAAPSASRPPLAWTSAPDPVFRFPSGTEAPGSEHAPPAVSRSRRSVRIDVGRGHPDDAACIDEGQVAFLSRSSASQRSQLVDHADPEANLLRRHQLVVRHPKDAKACARRLPCRRTTKVIHQFGAGLARGVGLLRLAIDAAPPSRPWRALVQSDLGPERFSRPWYSGSTSPRSAPSTPLRGPVPRHHVQRAGRRSRPRRRRVRPRVALREDEALVELTRGAALLSVLGIVR